MTEVSLKRNFVLNLLNTVTGLLFPLITFPYASRILLPSGIGQVQFFQSIIDYIALCTSLGIPLYAVREISKIRNDKTLTSKTSAEILLLHAMLTFGGYLIVLILISSVGKIQVDIPLFMLLSATLIFNAIGVPWFYQAVEDFKYITIRTVAIRIISLFALFILVKTKEDLLYYGAITVFANVGSNVFNFFRLRKFIDYSSLNIKSLNPGRHLKPALQIFVLNLIVSIYINLDSVMLGFLKNEQAVGYYSAATRLTKTILGIVTSFGTVLLPRFSNMIGNGQFEEFNVLANKAVSFVIALSLPLSIGLGFMATPIIHLFCGPNFDPSILTLQLIAPIILFIGLSGIVGMQILYPQGKERMVIIATAAGAIINFTLNYLLIPQYAQYGAAIATTCAEFLVIAIMLIIGKRHLPFRLLTKQNREYVVASLFMTLFLAVILTFDLTDYQKILLGIPVSCIIYFFYLYWRKDIFVMQLKEIINNKIQKKL
ncbi:polysaccharide biosynthesis protein [Macellibacteroides sp. HH-ZS]|nr:polysaccharide biosynthesis protein [Macellibacteroides sp. HH-ZS]